MSTGAPEPTIRLEDEDATPLDRGWQAVATAPSELADPSGLAQLELADARVPGGVAALSPGFGGEDPDGRDWWFRTRFEAEPAAPGEELRLELDGLATVADVFLNGERICTSSSMFAEHSLDVTGALGASNELAICCRALEPLLAESRRPRARWRTAIAGHANLRFFRTMILGRSPGFAPGPAVVGPWRPIRLRRSRELALDSISLRPGLEGNDGLLAVELRARVLGSSPPEAFGVELNGPSGSHTTELAVDSTELGLEASGTLRVPDVARWWPHTHGEAVLHEVRLTVAEAGSRRVVRTGRVGFRGLAPATAGEVEESGFGLRINDIEIFARGAVWTPIGWPTLETSEAELRKAIGDARAAGMNILRLAGTGCYESEAFHDVCDELGMLVWQDFMFANFDYPFADPEFGAMIEREAAQVASALAGRPSTVVVCGNSEVEQQAAMAGADPEAARDHVYATLLPRILDAAGCDAIYVPSAPCGGDLPFRPGRGVASYFGVGGYRRPLEDARRAEVQFAAECLALGNVPDEAALEEIESRSGGRAVVHHPAWKSGVPRDLGTGWDFDDVRDHYLAELFGLDPVALRSVEPERYLELSRAVSGEVMAAVFGEWRRAGSPCAGGILLWLRDLVPGAGWGVVDHRGEPKVAYHHLRRALAPIAVWTTDEGLGGVRVHLANDRPQALAARLRVDLYRNFEQRVDGAEESIALPPHSVADRDVEALLGHFVDASWAYRFGPAAQDVVVATLEPEDGSGILSQSFHFPAGRPLGVEPGARLGLEGEARELTGGGVELALRSGRLAYGVRIHAPGFAPADNAFSIAPGGSRLIRLGPLEGTVPEPGEIALSALNLAGRTRIPVGADAG